MMDTVKNLGNAIDKHNFTTLEEHMQYCAKTLRPMMDLVRKYADDIEGEVAHDLWPLPKYQEMLFIK